MISKITIKIPEGAQKLLKDSNSIFYKAMSTSVKSICIAIQGNVKRNIIPGWNMGHQSILPFFTGRLNRSITYTTNGLTGKVDANTDYAELQEDGGTIRPKGGGFLFISLTHKGRKRQSGLIFGKDFILAKKATIKPKKYFQRELESSSKQITEIVDKMLAVIGTEGGLK